MNRRALVIAALVLAGCSNPPKPKEAPKSAVRILQFYAATPRIGKGEKGELCYGVEGASAVRLDPAVESVWPALTRCFEVAPAATTTYTLTASDASGHSATETTSIEVGAARPQRAGIITEVVVSKLEIAPGEQVTVCYTARSAASVTITPGLAGQQSPARGCITDRPAQTTTYRVVANGINGQSDSEQVTVRVR